MTNMSVSITDMDLFKALAEIASDMYEVADEDTRLMIDEKIAKMNIKYSYEPIKIKQ